MKLISIITPCYNEEDNVEELYKQVKSVFADLPQYQYEHIFIDNCSQDKTVELLKQIAKKDKKIKIIVNTRNFGHICSPMHALLQTSGEAVISIVADLQDPPEMIKNFLQEWENGWKIVVGVKSQTSETFLMSSIRKLYYRFVTKIANIRLVKDFTGFGLYDKVIINAIRELDDPYPYFRGLICEIGYPIKQLPYVQPLRKRGITKNNFYTLFDIAMLGITNHSKVPIRLATFCGFALGTLSLVACFITFVLKLIFWNHFTMGIAPILMVTFFFFSILLFFMGILGEYVASIQTQIMKRPLVYELERINFDNKQSKPKVIKSNDVNS